MNAIILKPGLDTKGNDSVISRLGLDRKVDIVIRDDMNLVKEIRGYIENKNKIDCILVDEVQFLRKEQIDELFEIAVKLNIPRE